jgi:hypothetical protein
MPVIWKYILPLQFLPKARSEIGLHLTVPSTGGPKTIPPTRLTARVASRHSLPLFPEPSSNRMSQQHRKVVKRARRKSYLRRKKATARTTKK